MTADVPQGPTQLVPPALRPRYHAIRVLGRGAFGVVLHVWDRETESPAALKLLHMSSEDPTVPARFRREAVLTAQVDHRGVVRVLAHGETEGRLFIAYEYLGGGSLQEHLATGRKFTTDEVSTWGAAIADSLGSLHDLGVYHRDVKPGNLVFRDNGDLVLCDLGLAIDSERETRLTATAGVVGTLAYMAPELWMGEAYSPASEQFALAGTLLEAYSGMPLAKGQGVTEYRAWLLGPNEFLVPEAIKGTAPKLERCLLRALSKDLNLRFPSLQSFAAALRGRPTAAPAASASASVLATSIPATPPARAPGSVTLGPLLAAAIVGAGLSYGFQMSGPLPPSAPAPIHPPETTREADPSTPSEAEAELALACTRLDDALQPIRKWTNQAPPTFIGQAGWEQIKPVLESPAISRLWARYLNRLVEVLDASPKPLGPMAVAFHVERIATVLGGARGVNRALDEELRRGLGSLLDLGPKTNRKAQWSSRYEDLTDPAREFCEKLLSSPRRDRLVLAAFAGGLASYPKMIRLAELVRAEFLRSFGDQDGYLVGIALATTLDQLRVAELSCQSRKSILASTLDELEVRKIDHWMAPLLGALALTEVNAGRLCGGASAATRIHRWIRLLEPLAADWPQKVRSHFNLIQQFAQDEQSRGMRFSPEMLDAFAALRSKSEALAALEGTRTPNPDR